MRSLRTPDARFASLPGYPFAPHYTEVPDGEGGALRIHHLDEGPRGATPVLLMHGQPTWSYLYRKMVPPLVAAGHRVVAPDLVGFGRSDKPSEESDYTYARHVAWMSAWLEQNDLRRITLFCQDWGGLVGLRLVAAFPERFARVVAANTGLPDGTIGIPMEAVPAMRKLYETLPVVKVTELGERFRASEGAPPFLYWQKFCEKTPELRASEVVSSVSRRPLDAGTAAAYDAPFPDQRYVAGARKFPRLVPIFADDPELPANREAWLALGRFEKPFLTAFSDSDPVTAGGERLLQARIPGCKQVAHVTIEQAGHFLQEDRPEACADAILRLIREHPA
jgi:haloalkane dehalogenase